VKRARSKSSKADKKQKLIYEKPELSVIESGEMVVKQLKEQNRKKTKQKPKQKKKGKSALKTVFKIIFSIFAVLLALLFVVMGFGIFDEGDLLAPIENGKINVLLLGVDEEGQRTDTIMVASYDVNAGTINLISIPRDTKVYVENRKITRKINEVHAFGSKQNKGEIAGATATAEAVTQLTGLPINYYVEFSFSAIDNLFEILGPVEFTVPDIEGNGRGMNYDDNEQNLHIHLKPGRQMLSGNQIQQFLRYRKSNYNVGTGSDTDRIKRQQDLFKAVVDQKVNPSMLLKAPSIFKQISKDIKTNIQLGDITKYIRYAAKLTGESVHAYTLPGESSTAGGSYFIMNPEETKKLISETFGFDDIEPTDTIVVSDEHSQKVLKGGNKNSKTNTAKPKQTITPAKTPSPSSKPANTPAPTNKPSETKKPVG